VFRGRRDDFSDGPPAHERGHGSARRRRGYPRVIAAVRGGFGADAASSSGPGACDHNGAGSDGVPRHGDAFLRYLRI